MWAAQFFKFQEPNRWMTSGGLGTMGYGLPASVGVQLAHPKSLVIDIAGEASVQMTMQEMSTAAQYNLPIKIFILNNQYMGMVRQWQELLHGGRYSHSYSEALPDFVKLAEAYQGVGIRCEKPGDLDHAIKEMINVDKPVHLRLRRGSDGELLPDDPVGQGAQRNAAGRRRAATSARRSTKKARCWCNGKRGQARAIIRLRPSRRRPSGTRSPFWSRTSRACSPASSGCSPAAATTSTVSRCRRPSTPKHLSRITIVTSGTPMVIEQIKHQLERLVQVHRVHDMTIEGPAIERELAMVKVRGKGENRVEALRLADAFRARVIDAGTESFIFEITGAAEKIESFINLMLPIGLVEVSRTGVVAISRGPEGM